MEYHSCNGSWKDKVDHEGQQEGELLASGLPHPLADPWVISRAPCCHTVVLPPQWYALSRTHNVCEVCVNQTAGVSPSHLRGLHCSFLEMEAALDSFYLQERPFLQILSKTASLCSNFLSFYSPFSYYTACCQTVNRGPLGIIRSEEVAALPLEVAFASHGKTWQDKPLGSFPHIEDGSDLSKRSLHSSNVIGLSCRTNRTLNMYLLDSNLFWMYAERLGAPQALPVKEFATIVDLKEEVHYVLDQHQALVKSNLGTLWLFC